VTASDDERGALRPLVLLCAAGVGVRLLLFFLSGGLDLQSDEANYVYSAVSWLHYDVYFDQHRYLWPPGYTWFLAQCLSALGVSGLLLAKLLQIAASAVVGMLIMLFARRLFGMRAARMAGVLWIFYLPLIFYTHVLWNETLFLACLLPSLYLLLTVLQSPGSGPEDPRMDLALIGAGLSMSAALYLKEAPLYLCGALALLLIPFAASKLEGVRRAGLFLLVVLCAVLPWSLRNLEVYGHTVPLGASLGENAFNGLNADHRNFDLIPIDVARAKNKQGLLKNQYRPWFVEADLDSRWSRAEAPEFINTVERSVENKRLGLAYAREHPGWLMRTRVKKLADLVTPFSFYTRHLALGRYDESVLGSPLLRKLTSLWAMACPVLVLLLGLAGFLLALEDRAALWVLGLTGAYYLTTAMLVSMSRFRLPLVPFLIVLSAGLLTSESRTTSRSRRAATWAVWGLLLFLWWVNFPETWTVYSEMIWSVSR